MIKQEHVINGDTRKTKTSSYCICVLVYKSNLSFIGLSLALSCQAARHGVDLALAAWHAIEDVDVEVLLYDIPDLVVLTLLQVPLQQLVRVTGDTQDKLAGAEVQQGLVASHVLSLGQAGQHTQVVFVVTLLIPAEPEVERTEEVGFIICAGFNDKKNQVLNLKLCEGNSLFKERLGLTFMIVVHQFQIHVHKQRVEDLGQLCSVTVQNRLYELLQAAVVNLVQRRVSLLAVR